MTEKSYARQCIERDMDALDNPGHSDIRDLLAEHDALATERDAWKREAETAIRELDRIAAMLPDSTLDIVHRVQAELATLDALRDEHADTLRELRNLHEYIYAKPLEMLETLRDGPLMSWRIDGLHWFAKLDGVGADGKTFVGSGDTRDEAVDNARTYAERYLARASGSLDFPDMTPDDVARAHARMFGTLRDIKPGQYTTADGVRFEVPCKHPTSTEECCGNQVVYGGCSDDYGMLGEPMCCGKPIRRCDRCGEEVSGHATIIGAGDYQALGITDATPAKDLVEVLLAQKPARVGPSQYECAGCREPLTGLGAKVHECAKPDPVRPCMGLRCPKSAAPGNPLCYECQAEANGI